MADSNSTASKEKGHAIITYIYSCPQRLHVFAFAGLVCWGGHASVSLG